MSNTRKRLKNGKYSNTNTYTNSTPNKTQDKVDLANQFDDLRNSFKKTGSVSTRSNTFSHRNLYIIIGLIVIVALGGIVLAFSQLNNINPPPPTGTTYLSACLNDVQVDIHFHPFLTIKINGISQTIPAGIGLEGSCNRPIHTHDTSGYINVESATSLNLPQPTLGDFFDIWIQSFPSTNAGQWTGTVNALVTLNGNIYGTYTNNTGVRSIPLFDGGTTIQGYEGAGEVISITIT